jgi:hypothetical protein
MIGGSSWRSTRTGSGRGSKTLPGYVTDSTGLHEPKDPETSGLFQIYREIADPTDTRRVHKALSTGEMTWGEREDTVTETLDAFLAEPRERYRELMVDKTKINCTPRRRRGQGPTRRHRTDDPGTRGSSPTRRSRSPWR